MRRGRIGIGVFARAPVAGAAKTRLAPRIGFDRAARLQRQLTLDTVARARATAVGPVELHVTPSPRHRFFDRFRARGFSVMAQRGDDLGARMLTAFRRAMQRHDGYILVGTDCPPMTVRDLQRATRLLRSGRPVVIAPAEDGGYPLIGLRRLYPELFTDMRWGEATVFAATERRLRERGIPFAKLRTLWDLDRPADLDRYDRDKGRALAVLQKSILRCSIRG
jgi:rSAM/selenodomain-associated transferase 1